MIYRYFRLTIFIFFIALGIFNLTHTRYENIGDLGEPNFFKMLKWKFTRTKPVWPVLPNNKPTNAPNIPKIAQDDQIIVTYINHSTTLIQIGEENILTDPIWSEYAGPFGEFGVRRSVYPGVEMSDLPRIDVILISHSHYDHLDLPTLEKLTSIHQPVILTGMGVTRYIDYCKTKGRCYELQWWENVKLTESLIEFHFVPAYHWSSRFFFDKNTSLWGGFVITNKKDTVYFAGDTGFGDGKIFKMINEKYGNIRVALLPIGAYKPDWFFSSMHSSPKEAVDIFQILNASYAVPLHFDTFELTDEEYFDPLTDLKKALEDKKIDSYRFQQLPLGATIFIPKDQ